MRIVPGSGFFPGIGRGNQSLYEKMISKSLSANSPKWTWLKQNFKNK